MTADRPLRRVLIVSPSFPPMNAPDLQRVRMSLPYYRENGWEPVVLTVDPSVLDGSREEALVATIPAGIRIHRCGAFPLKWSRLLGLGNLGLRAWFPLLFAGARLIRREKIDIVFLSNTQFVTFTLGRIWLHWLGVPYVIDLQDPWRTDYYERPGSRRPPGGWKYQLARAQAWLLEGWSFRRVGAFMSVSQAYLDDLRKRYRWFHAVPADVIRFGASEADLTAARALPPSLNAQLSTLNSSAIRFVYTGAAGPIMPHALKVLFRALADFRARRPDDARRLRFEFLGTSYAPPGRGVETVTPVAREFGVEDLVHELPHRLGHLECLQIQAQADVLLLLGSSDLAYSPSKLYPYYLAKRPMLSVVFRDSYLESMLRELACSTVVTFVENTPADEAHEQLCAFFEHALTSFTGCTPPPRNDAFFRREFLAQSLTARQCALFEAAAKTASPEISHECSGRQFRRDCACRFFATHATHEQGRDRRVCRDGGVFLRHRQRPRAAASATRSAHDPARLRPGLALGQKGHDGTSDLRGPPFHHGQHVRVSAP
ncbi:MAG: glycosyltransferase [Nibricoccus sp.]